MAKNVLILEDNEMDLLQVIKIISNLKLDVNIIITKNYKEANDKIRANSFDVAIIDLFMNGKKNGSDLIHELVNLEKGKPFPIIVITSTSEDSLLKKVYENKVDSYLHKPIQKSKLNNALMEILN